MITVVRNYFKKSSQVVLWVIIAAFVIGLLPVAFRQITETNMWALRVNGQEVGYQEYLLERERAREIFMAYRNRFGEYADLIMMRQMGTTDPQGLAVESLKKQELLNQFADKIGVYISPEFVVQKMSDPAYVLQNLSGVVPSQLVDPVTGIDQMMLKRYLKHFKLSIDMFERIIERTLVDRFVADAILTTFYQPRFDVKQKYIAEYAKKQFSILEIPLKLFLEAEEKNEVMPQALKAFYETNSQQYWVPEKRSGMMWEFDAKTYDISVTNKQIEEYYENNRVKQFIDKPAKIQVRRILFAATDDMQLDAVQTKAARIKDEIARDSSQFAQIAMRVSEDQNSASKGGLIEPFVRGTHEIVFDRTAFLLKEDGEVSGVIQTKKGYEILQRVNKTVQTFKSLSSAKQEIKDTLVQKEFRKQFAQDMKKVIDQEETLAEFIRKKGGSPKELSQIALDDTPVATYLFKLQPGQRTFFVDDQKGVAIRLDKQVRRYLPALESIKETVTQDLLKQRAQEKLSEAVLEAKKAAATTSFAELQKRFDAEARKTDWIDPTDDEAVKSLNLQGALVSRMLQMEKPGSIITGMAQESGLVVRMDKIELFNEQEFREKIGQVTQSLENERSSQYMEGFVASLYRNAKIETNESLIIFES